ncbi:hypothetical protein ILYODFUR_001034 [Ilyodon furcidens]|uniref:Uncharacterized protein n=1 Tax=Ilyodon furcidens TaxID=33524 RepID=A0ABV0T7Z1_9TELE
MKGSWHGECERHSSEDSTKLPPNSYSSLSLSSRQVRKSPSAVSSRVLLHYKSANIIKDSAETCEISTANYSGVSLVSHVEQLSVRDEGSYSLIKSESFPVFVRPLNTYSPSLSVTPVQPTVTPQSQEIQPRHYNQVEDFDWATTAPSFSAILLWIFYLNEIKVYQCSTFRNNAPLQAK